MTSLMAEAARSNALEAVPASAGRRLDSIDLLRGVVMVVMALDHVRDYFSNAIGRDPMGLEDLDVGLYFTRWVTHFCAPTFVFLAGTGAFLYGSRGRSKRELSWFLLTRGLWLVVLEATVVRLSWNFHFDYSREFGGGVIFAIGWTMVALSLLVFLPTAAVATVGVLLVLFHNLLDPVRAEDLGLPFGLWGVLHHADKFVLLPGGRMGPWQVPEIHFVSGYCLIPWLGVLAAGYGFGSMFLLEPGTRRRQLIGLGLALTTAFCFLRYANLYGDPKRWVAQASPGRTLLAMLDCNKYPPSLLFLLMTLGPAVTALGIFEGLSGPVARFFVTLGRVPLFFYLLHLPLIHGLMVGVDYLRYGRSPYLSEAPWTLRPEQVPAGYGYALPVVYLVWLGVVTLLYPLCRWYARVKLRSRSGWLSYI